MQGRSTRTAKKKKNNVVIIVSGEDADEIKEELLLMVRKMGRKKELGFYITPTETVSLGMILEFTDLRLKISVNNGGKSTLF